MEPPPEAAVHTALRILEEVGAMTPDGALTALGHHLAQLPVDVRVGKLLILGTMFGCLDPIATIAAALSFKTPFVSPMEK